MKLQKPIHDTIPEDEYDSLVAKCGEDALGFIFDDDGLGFGDEGEEADWPKSGVCSSDEADSVSSRTLRRGKGQIEAIPISRTSAPKEFDAKEDLISQINMDSVGESHSSSIKEDVIEDYMPIMVETKAEPFVKKEGKGEEVLILQQKFLVFNE